MRYSFVGVPSSAPSPGLARTAAPGLPRWRVAVLTVAALSIILVAAVWLGWRALRSSATEPTPRPATTVVAANGWPGAEARLSVPTVAFPPDFGARKVYLDAGHGAPGNTGNTSCTCGDEQDFTLRAARALADRLQATGRFTARVSREGDRRVEYRDRVEEATRWGADVFLSLHSDVRGKFEHWSPAAGKSCPVSWAAPGFSVLWSDEGSPDLAAGRLALARATARRMIDVGLPAYGGTDYASLYERDAAQAGVFVDRRPADQRIFVLRRTTMPAVLVETHHALDPREAARWEEPRTLDAFAAAVTAALVDTLAPASSAPDPG